MNVPEGWHINTVGDLFDVQLGKMLNKDAKKKYPQVPYLTNFNVRWGAFDLKQLNTMYFSERDKEKFSLKYGDLIMCEGGEVGRCAIWKDQMQPCFYQKALHRLRPKKDILPDYFQSYMSYIAGTKLLDDLTGKTSIAHLTKEKLIELPVRVPPFPEQKKIARVLSTWDRAIEITEKLLNNSQQQKKALMQQLLTGKKRFPGFSGEWKKRMLGEISKSFSGGTPSRNNPNYYGGNIPWIKSGEVNDRYIKEVSEYITKDGLNSSSAKVVPYSSILIAMYGATAGKVGINLIEGAAINQAILAIVPNDDIYGLFLFYLLELEMLRALELVQGGQPNLNAAIIKSVKVLIPNLDEQKKIALVLSTTDREIETLQQKLDYLKQEKKVLMQQLLAGKRRVQIINKEDQYGFEVHW